MNEKHSPTPPILPPPIPRSPLLAVFAALAVFAGAANASAATYSAPAPITIPGFSQANPYPAAIDVTGLTGTVTDVNVRLNNLTHGTIDDVAVAVQAPSGQAMLLMDGAGGFAVSDVTLTIDDEAAQQFSGSTNPATGSYRPAQYYTGDSFPSPGPGTGYCTPGPAGGGSCTLSSAFDGSNPIGSWKLFVIDTLGTSSGQIAGGWSLELTTSGPADFDPPQTTIDSGPNGAITTATAAFEFSASETAAFECRLDGAAFAACSSPAIYTGLGDGAHTFSGRATDPAGNVDPSAATRSFTVATGAGPGPEPGPGVGGDTTAPRVTIEKAKVKRAKRSATVSFTASDETTPAAQLALTCSLDGGGATPCSSPLTLRRLRPGRHTLEVRATDGAGNRSAAEIAAFRLKRKR